MFFLKNYQAEAVDDLLSKSKKLLGRQGSKVLILKAPTGSGKTVITAEFLKQLVIDNEVHKEIAFIWTAPRALHTQSKAKLEAYYEDKNVLECLEFDDLIDNEILNKQILFLNWESINKEENIIIRHNERDFYLDKIIENTSLAGRKVVLIIDESHHHATSEISRKLISDINPSLAIEVSATPVADSPDEISTVYIEDVKHEGMIKETVLLQDGYGNELTGNQIKVANTDGSDALVLEDALKKRADLQKTYKKNKIKVNPLLLIQLPPSKLSQEEIQKKRIIELLDKKHDISVSNGKLAIYLSNEKTNLEKVEDNTNKVEVLIFKQAISIGWDCPRAQVLLLFRDWKSITFSIQTIGRIMRMPEPLIGHYQDESLNQAYIYTNLENVKVHEDLSSGYLSLYRSRRAHKTNLLLESYYRQRKREKTRLGIKFISIFLENTRKYHLNNKISKKNNKVTQSIVKEAKFNNLDEIDNKLELKQLSIDVENIEDLQKLFDYFIRDNLSPFFPEQRSIDRVKESIYSFFELELNLDISDNFTNIVKIILDDKNLNHFKKVIDSSKIDYQGYVKELDEAILKDSEWNIPESTLYSTDVKTQSYKKSLMQPFYYSILSKPEEEFINYLEQSSKVIWWFKNGEQDRKSFAIQYEEDHKVRLFFVDFIVLFKNKKIGFFDTKSGIILKNAGKKSDALIKYLKKDKNFMGGIVTNTDKNMRGSWMLYKGKGNQLREDDFENWEHIDF
tara:strand:- start:227 stop:2434 length:2208 start_codon:yes stop_codon:yes gene_type:complete